MKLTKIEPIDRKLLFLLSLDARASLTRLAKQVKSSKQRVNYRLSLLEKKGIIQGYQAVVNIYKIGLVHYRVLVKYRNVDRQTQQEFFDFLLKHPKVAWMAELEGAFDSAFIVWAENIEQFESVYDEILELFGHVIGEHNFSVATKISYLKHKFFIGKPDNTTLDVGLPITNIMLDKIDKSLLSLLMVNGRATMVSLALKLGLSAKAVKDRVDRLKKAHVLLGFQYKLNHRFLGLTHRKIMLKLTSRSKKTVKSLFDHFTAHPNVIYLVKIIGEYDFEVELMTASDEEFHLILQELRFRFPAEIGSYETFIHYDEPKSGIISF